MSKNYYAFQACMKPVGSKGVRGPALQPLTKDFKPTQLTSSSAVVLVRTSKDIQDKLSQICMVTKTKRVDFGGSTVFPGGLTSYDADGRFVHTYLRMTSNINSIKKHDFSYDEILRRINALRELFEETGILLGQSLVKEVNFDNNNKSEKLIPKYATYPHKAHIVNKIRQSTETETETKIDNNNNNNNNNNIDLSKFDFDEWREKIIASPFEFENMYDKLGMLPDITALVPWARFQTPYSSGRRWDTHFYLALINNSEISKLDTNCFFARGHEISNVHWLTCDEMLYYYKLTLDPSKKSSKNDENIKYRFPPPTLKMIEELSVIMNENKLYEEWKYRYQYRHMKQAYLPKMIVFTSSDPSQKNNGSDNNNNGMKDVSNVAVIGPRDYLYNKIEPGNSVKLNQDYEKHGIKLQRVYLYGNGTCKLTNSYKRLYSYSDDQGEEDNGQNGIVVTDTPNSLPHISSKL